MWFFVVVLVSVGFVLYFAVHAVLHVNVRAPKSLACVSVCHRFIRLPVADVGAAPFH